MSKPTNVERTDWKKLDQLDGQLDGRFNNVPLPRLKAVLAVESRGDGFLPSGKPKILFEGHQFYKRLKKAGYKPREYRAGNEDILYPRWTKAHYVGGEGEYRRLHKAMEINKEIALQCASYGIAQIMGFNYSVCGYDDVHGFVDAMQNHDSQIEAFIGFLESGLWHYLEGEKANWTQFAKRYNGPLYWKNDYHGKLARAERRYTQDPQEEFKPLKKSRTLQGGAVAGISTVGVGATVISQVSDV